MLRWLLPFAAIAPTLAAPAEAAKKCPEAQDRYIAALLIVSGNDVALFIASFRGPMTTAHVQCLAQRGDKPMILELGRRYEAGIGVPANAERAEDLYDAAATPKSGTTMIYVPGVGKAPGRVQSFRIGPDVPGLPEGHYRRAMMHIDGRAAKPSHARGLKLLKRAAKAGYRPAAEMLVKLSRQTI